MSKDLSELLGVLLQNDKRYTIEAYSFVFEALEFTIKSMGVQRHIAGQELLEGIRQYALQQFGELAKMVFNSWGVHKTDDFGEIVFNLVSIGLMGKTDQDSKDDFKNVYNFSEAFNLNKTEKQTTDGFKPPINTD